MKVRFIGTTAGLGLSAFLASAGCGSEPASLRVGETESAVQGGAVDQTHSYAVGVCGGAPGQCQYLCSGALIAPNLVVTARHCVTSTPSRIDCASDRFGSLLGPASAFNITTYYSMNQSTQGWHSVSKIITPTPTPVCGNDIALLILADNVPAGVATPITPAVQYPITDHTRYSTTNTAIGYGVVSPQSPQSAGVRHIRQNIDIQCIPGDPALGCNTSQAFGGDDKELLGGDGTCEGDSGSSAYEQTSFNSNKPVSLGVLSRGGVSTDETTCIGAVYTRLDSWKDLIIGAVKEASAKGGYPLPNWTNPPVAPGTDAGPTPVTNDSGVSTVPAPGELGTSCSTDNDCDSKTCRSASSGESLCTQSCGGSNACPDGYACSQGLCFASKATPKPAATTMTTTTSGCSAVPGRRDPTKPIPRRRIGLGLVGLAVARRRRQR